MKDILEVVIKNLVDEPNEVSINEKTNDKVNSFAQDNSRFETLSEIYVKNKENIKKYKIEKVGYAKNQIVLKLDKVDTVEEAEKLRNSYILVDRADLEELPEGVYYLADLMGLEVYTEEGELLGKVDDIFQTGSNDVYVVKNDLGKTKLLPGTDEVIKKVSLEEGKIIVNLIKGL